MRTRIITLALLLITAFLMSGFYCTKVDYTNPLDNKGTSYAGDSAAADDNHDGIPNLYDKTWKGVVKTYPKIVFNGPDTVVIAKDDPLHVWAHLDSAVTAADTLWGEGGKVWGSLTDSIKRSTVFTSVCSTYTVVYTVRNLIDSQSSKSRTVIVDCAPPVITLVGANPLRLKLGTPYVDSGATATDNIDGNVTSRITATGKVDINHEGVDTVTYSASDKAGNVGTQQRMVIVYAEVIKDTVKPVLTVAGSNPLTIQVNAPFSDPGATAVDNIDGAISSDKIAKTIATLTGGAADFATFTKTAGNYVITYSVSDAAGNRAIATRTVNVKSIVTGKDTMPPVITFLVCSVCTTKVGQAWTVPGYTAFDDHDGDVTKNVVAPPAPNLNVPGTTQMSYTIKDSAGNSATYIRTVTVVGVSTDTTKPVITLGGAVQCTVSLGKSFTEPGYSATDNIDGVITDKVSRTVKNSAGATVAFGAIPSAIDRYTVSYDVTDASNNAAITAHRYVVVKDTAIDTTVNGDLLKKYGVPLSQPLASVPPGPNDPQPSYATITTEGTGPKLADWTKFDMKWDLGNNGLYVFSFSTSDGVPDWYVPLAGKVVNTFNQASPGFTLTGSGVAGLDGAYYIVATVAQMVWVKKDGTYAVVFKK